MLIEHVPRFTSAVPDGGYRWWYVDGISDCLNYGVVVIAFIGSVFSPYYYRSRQRQRGDPFEHCAINVALYSQNGNRWSMTERNRRAVSLDDHRMRCGRSSVSVNGNELRVIVDERTAPLGRRLCGEVKVYAAASNDEAFFLDQGHQHQWQPIVPGGQVVVEFEKPQIQWQGHAYVDTNNGRRPLESDFRRWDWSRYLAGDQTRILYKTEDLAGESRCLSLSFDQDARVSNIDAPREVELPRTGWGVERRMQHDADVRVIKTLEDTPFYARSMLGLSAGDNELTAMHESLTLERFRKTWVRTLLPFRMPRITR